MAKKKKAARKYQPRWVSWNRQRAGADGRKPSGIVMTRTTTEHATVDGAITLCGRDIGTGVSGDYPLPKCTVCDKAVVALSGPN